MVKEKGFIYFIQEEYSRTIKIGKTKSLDNRLTLFDVKLPFDFELIHVIYSKNYSQTESLLHNYFKSNRVNGEWFSLTEDEIKTIKLGEYPEDIKLSIKGLFTPSSKIISKESKKGEVKIKQNEEKMQKREEGIRQRELKELEVRSMLQKKKEMEKINKFIKLKEFIVATGETRVAELRNTIRVKCEILQEMMFVLVKEGWLLPPKSRASGYQLSLSEDDKRRFLNDKNISYDQIAEKYNYYLQQLEQESEKNELLYSDTEKEIVTLKKIILETGITKVTELKKMMSIRDERVKVMMEELMDDGWLIKHKIGRAHV